MSVGQIYSSNLRIELHQMLDEAECKLATIIAHAA